MYYIIDIQTFPIDSYYRTKINPLISRSFFDEPVNLVLEFENPNEDQIPAFICNQYHFFTTFHFKKLLEDNFTDIDFETVCSCNNFNYGRSFKINFSPLVIKDFCFHKDQLIVSKTALEFLKKHNIFKEHFIGEVYGKTYNIYSNIFEINNDNYQEFIKVELPKLRKRVEEVRNEIDEEYSRRTR